MGGFRLGVDVGGTFTDLVLSDPPKGTIAVAKVPSTPADQALGVLAGLDRLGVTPDDLARFAHGTTVATNAVLERRLARTVLVTTEGFRDLLEIGRQNRPKLYDLFADRPPPVVPRSLVVEAPERVAVDGSVLRPLDAEGASAVAGAVAALSADAVAICLLHAFVRPDHERSIADALAAALPIHVSLSSDVLPVFREYERASTTAINAAVAPEMAHYLGSLSERLRDAGLTVPVEVMRSGGGTFDAATAARLPVHTLLSGPAAGAWGAAAVASAAGFPDAIAFDMGGTSTDVTLIEAGAPGRTAEGSIGGLPFAVATTDIHTVGAGGGSLAWADDGGALRVGPTSAGADPGPACYGRGGTEPTVTDAYLLLGWLDQAEALGGGALALHAEPARTAIAALATALGLEPEACAEGIVRIAEAHIVRALRVVSVERGKDPRPRALLAFGGAGPLHQGAVSRALGCRAVIVPRHPGVLSALGLLAAPVAHDVARTRVHDLSRVAATDLAAEWQALVQQAGALLAAQGVEAARVVRSVDCRYRGQAFELEVAAPTAEPSHVAAAFHLAHRERYGYDQPDQPVEAVTLRVRAEGPPPDFVLPTIADGRGADTARRGERTVLVDGAPRPVPVLARDSLGAGDTFAGPALVTGVDATCLVLPGQAVEVDGFGNLVITEG